MLHSVTISMRQRAVLHPEPLPGSLGLLSDAEER
jgi:hypothetical protein